MCIYIFWQPGVYWVVLAVALVVALIEMEPCNEHLKDFG